MEQNEPSQLGKKLNGLLPVLSATMAQTLSSLCGAEIQVVTIAFNIDQGADGNARLLSAIFASFSEMDLIRLVLKEMLENLPADEAPGL